MSLNKNYILLFFIVIYANQHINAQQKTNKTIDSTHTENLDAVIITATRTERQLSSLPLPAQIVSKQEITNINSLRLSDILNEQTGLITIPDFGGGEGLQLQGLDSQYTLILIDGVPLIGRSAGTLDISRVSIDNVKQIEIVKGASSSLYGSEALAGVINVITDKTKPGFSSKLNYRLGTYNTNDASVGIGYNKNKFSINGFMNRFSSDGYKLNDNTDLKTVEPFTNYTYNLKSTYAFNEDTKLFVSGRYFTQNQDYVASEVLKGESDIREWNTHVKLSHTYNSKWNSYFEFYATRYKADEFLNNPDDSRFSESNFNQLLVRPEVRGSFSPSAKSTLIGGLGWTYETLVRTDFTSNPVFNAPYVYVQYDTNPTERINIILGARFDDHSAYQSQFSPKAALRYKISETLAVKGSVGYGFKAPDFRQLYFDFTNATVGYTVLGYNAVTTTIPELQAQGQIAKIVVPVSEFEDALNPENSVSFNFGIDFNPTATLQFSTNIFRNNITDLIDTRVIASKTNGQNVFSYYNVNQVYTQGLEFNGTWAPNTTLKISGGYQLLFAKDKNAEEAFKDGDVYARDSETGSSFVLDQSDYFGLFNRSRHMANFKIFYNIQAWNANANIRGTYRSKYGLYDTNGNSYLDTYDDYVPGYSTWDVAFNKMILEHYTLSLGVENIFDFTDTQNISNIPGRIVYGKFNIQF